MSAPAAASDGVRPVPTWRKVVAAMLDLLFVFAVGGYAIGCLAGGLTEEGFKLEGAPAFLLLAVVILYFVLCARFLSGTPCFSACSACASAAAVYHIP